MVMLKITFVYPDFESLGVEYLMAACQKEGHLVAFIFYHAEDSYLGKKINAIPYDKIAEKIVKTQPDLVMFSCVTDNYQYQLNCARALKKLSPKTITVFGGVHATAVPEKVLENEEVDFVAIGEAENSLSNLLKNGDKNNVFIYPDKPIEGLVFKDQGKLIGEFKEGPLADLDQLPYPYKDSFYSSSKGSSEEYYIITSRGCPYSCSFCFNSYLRKLQKKKIIRQRSVDNVMGELIHAKEYYSPKYILFLDDSFTTNKAWILEFCKRYKKEINLPFACIANPFYVNREIVEALSSAGCLNMQIGIESLSEELCNDILHRKSNNAKIAQTIKTLKEFGIMVQVDHMLGIPEDTIKRQEESALFYNKYRPNLISIFWLSYYPKTAIVEIAQKMGLLNHDDIKKIESGRLAEESYLSGGSTKNPELYYGIALLFNYIPILPRWLVNMLIYTRFYRLLKIKSFFIVTALPRAIQSIFNRKDFRGRSHIRRFINNTFKLSAKF